MSSARDFALDIIARTPGLANNPNAQQMVEVIRSGDSARGEQIARNLCDTYGITPDEALRRARSLFRIQ